MPKPHAMAFDRQSARSIDVDGRLHVAKTCIKCGIAQPLELFSRRGKSKDGRQNVCKSCAKIAKAKWAMDNSSHVKAYSKRVDAAYRAKNKEAIAQSKQAYYKANAEKIIAKACRWQIENRERVNEKNAAWRKANPAACNAKNARRRAAMFNATPPWADMKAIIMMYTSAASQIGVDVDHIVPLNSKIVCGLHVVDNLQVIPSIQNRRKGNKCWPDMP